MHYLVDHRESLNEEFAFAVGGSWREDARHLDRRSSAIPERTDEIFMAWHYAKYVQAVAAAGKNRGPAAHVRETPGWAAKIRRRATTPAAARSRAFLMCGRAAGAAFGGGPKGGLDMEAPDLYASGFASWCNRYHRPDNPLFIPETNGGSAGAANVFYAVGEQAALGFSPFAIDAGLHGDAWPNSEAYEKRAAQTWRTATTRSRRSSPCSQPRRPQGRCTAFVLDKSRPAVDFTMSGMNRARAAGRHLRP